MLGRKLQSLRSLRRQERFDAAALLITVDKRLRRNESAREGNVELARIRFAHQRDRRFLRLAITQLVLLVHKHRRHAVGEFARQFSIEREVDPAKLLNRRQAGGKRFPVHAAVRAGKRDAIADGLEFFPFRFLELDGEADEVFGRLGLFPVHSEQRHSVTAVDLE